MSIRCRPPRLLALLVAGALATSGCSTVRPRRQLTPPDKAASLDKRSPYLKAHMKDGGLYVLSRWSVGEAARTVAGEGEQLGPDRRLVSRGAFQISIDSVALFETNVLTRSPAVIALAIITGISLALTAYCIANPKACFGSCPTFYVSDGTREVLQAEGFSDSVSPSLERQDVDALYRAQPRERELDVRMTNEALETHVVRYVHVLAAPRPPGGRVLASSEGEFWSARDLRVPDSCTAAEGDCLAAVRAFDGRERVSETDGQDLAAREVVDLRFPAAETGPVGLVIASRQTLLSTYLFYQALSYMGRSAAAWMAALERGDGLVRQRLGALAEALGGIEVLIPDAAGGWVRAGEVRENGPLATDVKVVPLPRGVGETGRIRLRLTRGSWRLDYLALASLGNRVTPLRLRPVRARPDGRAVASGDTSTITTLPGEALVFSFRLPPEPAGYELFLETRGYYLEWMREEWLREENPERLVRLLAEPNAMLRELAPEFKRQEAAMEEHFWRSRYARP